MEAALSRSSHTLAGTLPAPSPTPILEILQREVYRSCDPVFFGGMAPSMRYDADVPERQGRLRVTQAGLDLMHTSMTLTRLNNLPPRGPPFQEQLVIAQGPLLCLRPPLVCLQQQVMTTFYLRESWLCALPT